MNKCRRDDGNRKSPFANHNCHRQASPMDTNIYESKYKKQNVSIVSKFLPTRYLLFTKRKIVALPRNLANTTLTTWCNPRHQQWGILTYIYLLISHNTAAPPWLSKLHNLRLTTRKHQTNPRWRILQKNWPVLFKSVKVTKDKGRLFQVRKDKGDLTSRCNAVP